MLVHIHDHLTVGDIQDRISKCFPGLCIAFYEKPLPPGTVPPAGAAFARSTPLGAIRTRHHGGDLTLKSWYTVQQVVELFRQYGLHAFLFRGNGSRVVAAKQASPPLSEWVQMALRETTAAVQPSSSSERSSPSCASCGSG